MKVKENFRRVRNWFVSFDPVPLSKHDKEIVRVLQGSPMRFSELKQEVEASKGHLWKRLNKLRDRGVVRERERVYSLGRLVRLRLKVGNTLIVLSLIIMGWSIFENSLPLAFLGFFTLLLGFHLNERH